MEIIIFQKPEEVYAEAARRIAIRLKNKPDAVLGLATGRTMLGVYDKLVQSYKKGEIDFFSTVTFNLDEYLGIPQDHPESFLSYMKKSLFQQVNIRKKNIFIPNSMPTNVEEECRLYENSLRKKGGIDLQLLGIGRDGHIGFNEPSSSLTAGTRVKTLTDETLRDNFGNKKVARFAITMGIGTIMEAGEIMLLALGSNKAEAVKKTVEGPVTASCPASALQLHPKVKVILDEEAARDLERKDYYEWVWKHKKEADSF
jgi:glucosamine-6-phosphate deaminase